MLSVYLSEPNNIQIKEQKLPEARDGMAVIRIKAAGICGSDVGAFRGTNPLVSYPRVIGHELAGEIVEIGSNPRNLKVGDRVVVDPYLYCGHCYPCSLGRTNCCESLNVLGVHVDGGMAEYFLHPDNMLIPLPANIPWEIAPLAEPLTIALHALHRAGLKRGMHMAINGAGAIGLLAALSAMAYGAEPILVDLVEERLAFARTLGIRKTINLKTQNLLHELQSMTNGRMAEVVMEASGANSAIQNTLEMASYAGTVILTGWPKQDTLLATGIITKKELDIRGSRTSAGEFEEALELISTGKVDVRPILSKVVSLNEAPAAVRELSEHPDRYIKINVVL